ncbi:hypothetical protein KC19_12G022600 [Ceratodon purpureus]|uniref:Uncharacterized protein n=1 Tax=Ceratodon purpureus TaxID=3225 RepID=A0A8T0G3T1_CERPU|nr:hypothetical protein KC19_12G022600 [Ceratodon purpureus]
MDGGVLPLAFYCRNAQLFLQKAAESRQSNLGEEELQHWKAFTALVTSAIPTHPQFRGWKGIQEIQALDLHAHIGEAKQRIRELEDSGHLDRPSPTTNGQKHGTRPPSKPVEASPLSGRSSGKSLTSSPRAKLGSLSKISSEVMLKTSKSVRISEAAPKQRPQRWDIETYGVAKTTTGAKPVSLIQRLKRGAAAQPVDSKASPTRASSGKDIARPLSAQGIHTPTSGEITPYRPTPRSRDTSRMRGGAGPSTTLPGRGSTGLKALTSSTAKVRSSDEDTNSLHEKLYNVSNRGSTPASSLTRQANSTPTGKPKHLGSGGPWVRGILRNGSDDAAADSNGAMAKANLDDEEELIEWIPSRQESARLSQRSSNEGGHSEESSVSEARQRGSHQGELREELRRHAPTRGLGLREWKGGFVRGEQRFDESRDSLDATTGAAVQELRANDGSRRIVDNRPVSAPVRRTPTRVVKSTSPSPGPQRGVKENCERFRRQMKLLKEKAEDTRMREEEVESMAERLQRRLVDDIDPDGDDIWCSSTQIHVEEESEELCELHRVGKSSSFHTVDPPGLSLERTSLESLNRTMTRLMNGDFSDPGSTPPLESVSHSDKKMKTMAGISVSNSGSSTSSQASLPLSHYIQKLRDSQLKNSPGKGANQHRFEVMEDKSSTEKGDAELFSVAVSRTDSSERRELSLSASTPGSSPAILLPNCSSSGSPKLGSHRHPPPPHYGNRLKSQVYHNRITKADSSSVAMVQTSPHGQHLTTISSGAMVAASRLQDGGKLQDQQALFYPPDESRARVLGRSIYESAHHDANDEKIAQLQRVLGELKGSMEGVKIRIEVEGEGWRGRVDRLEKELESVKETDDEIIAVKHSFKDELKTKLSEYMADTEKLLRQEREQVQVIIEERIEKQLKAQQLGNCWADMKNEMQLLWNEMDSLIKNREDIASHVEHLTFITNKVQEHSSREQDMLKSENGLLRKQLQSLQSEGVQASSETDKEDLRQAVEKLKNDGIDMKLEIQSLRNIEKILKVELGELRTRLGKVQDETEELEREKEMTLVDGTRERLLIMERVENLSQLYLGGLEEVRQDLSHVKFGCSERIEEIESQWNDLKRNQEITCEGGSALLPRQVLLEELDQFRCEIAEMVVIERGLLKETLEMESTSIWRKVMDAYANNKSEMLNMLKLEIQKQLHSAREKVLLMTHALKRDMDALKTEISHTQDGAEELSQIVLAAEGKKEVAAQAAADATSSAAKAREILTDMLVAVENEVTTARHESMLLQENLVTEKELAIAAASETRMVSQQVLKEKEAALVAFQEVRQKSQELQDYLEKESPKLVTAMVVVQKERDTASQAASEATSSAMKAGELLAEVLGSFNLEMAKARHINMQLQEELEHERGLSTQHSQEVQDRLSEELEAAISSWKQAMNEEVAKAKESSEGENLRQLSGFSTPLDFESYISKTEEKLNNLMTTVGQLQDSTNNHRDEKKRLKQYENERNEKDLTANMSQLNQVVRTVEERVNETSSEQTELRKRLKRFEGMQTDVIHSVGEMRSNTCTLEKTVNLFLPQYDAAARIVNEISCKVERLEERIEGFACDEGLAQVISRVAETKIESLKELTSSAVGLQDLGRDLRDLQDRVENNDHSHCQAIAEVENRVAVVECTLSDIQNGGQSSEKGVSTLTESVDELQRKMDILEQNGVLSEEQEPVSNARLVSLESRVEHVASATFSNLQLLDNKVERVSMGVQSALEGAALAENKCGALGAELVKVFRMLTATKISSNAGSAGGTVWPQLPLPADDNRRPPRGRSHSPPSRSTTQRLESRSQSPPPRLSGNPAWDSNRGPPFSLRRSGANPALIPSRPKAGMAREKRLGVRGGRNIEEGTNQSSEVRKVEARERLDRAKESFSGEPELEPGMGSQGGSPTKDDNWLKSYPRESLPFKDGGFRGQALTVVEDRQRTGPYLAIDRRAKNLQKTNIRLESGRIHVNVSRRSGAPNGAAM